MTRDDRINIRISTQDKAAIEKAAKSVGLTVSGFMAMAALEKARTVMAKGKAK